MILHIPHDPEPENDIPDEYSDFIGPAVSMRDVGAYRLFEKACPENYTVIRFNVSRLVCDVERFETGEPMDSKGMGICYERNANLERIRYVTPEHRDDIIRRYYRPHHRMLSDAVEDELARFGRCFIVDGHTFSDVPLPYEDDTARPEVCLGYDEEDAEYAKIALAVLESHDVDVMENRPYAGSIKPFARIGDPSVTSLMFEIRRDVVDDSRILSAVSSAIAAVSEAVYG